MSRFVIASTSDNVVASTTDSVVLEGIDVQVTRTGSSTVQNTFYTSRDGAHQIEQMRTTRTGTSTVQGVQTTARTGNATLIYDPPVETLIVVGYAKPVIASTGDYVVAGLTTFSVSKTGKSGILNAQSKRAVGRSAIMGSVTSGREGVHRVIYQEFVQRFTGTCRIRNTITPNRLGLSRIRKSTTRQSTGKYGVFNAYASKKTGSFRILNLFGKMRNGRARIANNAVAGYALYIGEEGPPNYAAGPSAFSNTLPVTIELTPPVSGTKLFWIVCRKVNKYGVESQDQYPHLVSIKSDGTLDRGSMQSPAEVFSTLISDETIRITGKYYGLTADAFPADKWRVWISDVAEPDTDTPPDFETGIAANLVADMGSISPGTYHVAVGVYRTVDDVVSVYRFDVEIPVSPPKPLSVGAGFEV